ncbi:ERCC5 [Cordylochernes scorpioides]|uniref:ERCC5 n=1 Tax=Cordylochernes scorpioides TaxID=51811 RepID=A0ABY6JYI4_9ARAC|nr:ERCC5 [Cordylochernes scorpioides]
MNHVENCPVEKYKDAELQALLDEDSTQTQEKLAKQLQVSQGAVSLRLNSLRMTQKLSRWVPHELSERQQEWRLDADAMLILQHDNAPAHNATVVKNTIKDLSWELLHHPLYSPGLAPSDYHLFTSLGHALKKQEFSNSDILRKWLRVRWSPLPFPFLTSSKSLRLGTCGVDGTWVVGTAGHVRGALRAEPHGSRSQCAHLDATGQTQGTITEDSDIWVFGGRRVYRNFFTQGKYVEFFQDSEISRHLGLNRAKMVNLALLTGSDYTTGIEGIGPVTAMEVLSEFSGGEGIQPLMEFRKWWQAVQKDSTAPVTSVRAKLRRFTLPTNFPDPEIWQAYLEPTVDNSKDSFTWGRPDLDLLRQYPLSGN